MFKDRIWRIEGLEELEQKLLQLAEIGRADLVARNTLTKAVKWAMEPVYSDVAANAPYDEKNTGPIHLRETVRLDARIPTKADHQSIHVNETDAVICVVSVKKSAVSLSQEFGNARTAAQPFLRSALNRNAETVVNLLKGYLGDLIDNYARKLARGNK